MINPVRIKTLILKELHERKSRFFIGLTLLCLVSALFFLPRFYERKKLYSDVITELIPQYQENYPGLLKNQLSLVIYTDIFFQIFILIPSVASPFLGVLESVISEKQNRTLESLLSLPLSDSEILIGKMGGSIISGITLAWLIYLVHLLFFLLCPFPFLFLHLISIKWIYLVLIFAPVLSYIVNAMGVILAIWLKKMNTAGNFGVFVLSPFFMFVFLIFSGKVVLDSRLILIFSFIGLCFGSILLFIATKLFNRENLLLRY